MRKRQFLFGGEIHVYLLESQRALLHAQIERIPDIPGLLTVEKIMILRKEPYISAKALGVLCDWFPSLLDELRELETKREVATKTNAALARRSF